MIRTVQFALIYRSFLSFALVSVCGRAVGQAPFEAITVVSNGAPGYVNGGGVGWMFTPTVNIRVTGVGGCCNSPLSLQFWDGTNQVISSYMTSFHTEFQYDAIEPLSLVAGHRYGISLTGPTVVFVSYGRPGVVDTNNGTYPVGAFYTSDYLDGFANYRVSDTMGWLPNPAPPNNTNAFFFGPAFQFQVVPEPSVACLLVIGILLGMIWRRTTRKAAGISN
jgi:hypothetical protein